MKKLIVAALVSVFSMASFAQNGDLVLPGAKWQAKFNGYICAAFGAKVAAPAAFAKFDVQFIDIVTDSSLDNGLIKATFTEEGKACRYNAIVFADNAASTMRLVESKAYATSDNSECAAGKAVLDSAFEANDYLYYGHPHNLGVMAPVEGAAEICNGSDLVGINFVVSGKLPTTK
jgi:hypothetical protein